jgi:hypothetical protein
LSWQSRFIKTVPRRPSSNFAWGAAQARYGDSVGHYEGDTLVIDTMGIRTDRPYAMIDLFGTPYTKALHMIERYRLRDYDDVKGAIERNIKRTGCLPAMFSAVIAASSCVSSEVRPISARNVGVAAIVVILGGFSAQTTSGRGPRRRENTLVLDRQLQLHATPETRSPFSAAIADC